MKSDNGLISASLENAGRRKPDSLISIIYRLIPSPFDRAGRTAIIRTDSYSLKRNGSESCRFFYCERENDGNIYNAVLAQRGSHHIDGLISGRR